MMFFIDDFHENGKKNNNKETNCYYQKLYDTYSYLDYFQESKITISYHKKQRYIDKNKNNLHHNIKDDKKYVIDKLTVDNTGLNDEQLADSIENVIQKCNINLHDKKYPDGWQLFYLYKELIQIFTGEKFGFNYFRGESDDYKLAPGILRDNIDDSYRHDFEEEYKRLCMNFPERVEYYSNDRKNRDKREEQLSILQHYELKTSLLDISTNPFISMIFMFSSEVDEYRKPSLYLFKVNDSGDKRDFLFSKVKKNRYNLRINAQKGAFFNFDKAYEAKKKNPEGIPCVKIILDYNESEDMKRLNIEYNTILKFIEKYGKKDTYVTYLKIIDKQIKNIDKFKADSLREIRVEMLKKLNEYYYSEEDLFPDFFKQIEYVSRRYALNKEQTSISFNDALYKSNENNG